MRGREVIELVSDLGGGKTAFVRGLARGMGSEDVVASPTFTVNKQYASEQLTLHHFDFYRLTEAGIMAEDLTEILENERNVVVVEWAGIVEDILPSERLTIKIMAKAETEREFIFNYPVSLQYLIPTEKDIKR